MIFLDWTVGLGFSGSDLKRTVFRGQKKKKLIDIGFLDFSKDWFDLFQDWMVWPLQLDIGFSKPD